MVAFRFHENTCAGRSHYGEKICLDRCIHYPDLRMSNSRPQRPSPGQGKKLSHHKTNPPPSNKNPKPKGTSKCLLWSGQSPPQKPSRDRTRRKDQKEKTSQAGGIWLTGVGAAATFLQAIFLIRSFRETKKAANAAKKSAVVAEDTLRITQRTYLDIIDHQIYRRLTPGNNPQITYEITNIGNTVAQITEIMHVVDIVSEFPLDPNYSK